MKNSNITFHEDIAIADTAFTVKGKDKNELFENAAYGLMQAMSDPTKINPQNTRNIKLEGNSLDTLLFDFLNEILLLKDSENLLFTQFKVNIKQEDDKYILDAVIKGEKADPEKHKITIDVKAITMHMFKLEKTEDGYEARVVVDI